MKTKAACLLLLVAVTAAAAHFAAIEIKNLGMAERQLRAYEKTVSIKEENYVNVLSIFERIGELNDSVSSLQRRVIPRGSLAKVLDELEERAVVCGITDPSYQTAESAALETGGMEYSLYRTTISFSGSCSFADSVSFLGAIENGGLDYELDVLRWDCQNGYVSLRLALYCYEKKE